MADTDHGPHDSKPNPFAGPFTAPPVMPAQHYAAESKRPINLATDDVPCRNCGFNLRGLTETGNCPECGAPIWNSIQEDLLIYSNAPYVAGLHRGLICVLIAWVLQLVLSLLTVVAMIGIIIVTLRGAVAAGGGAGVGGFAFTTTTSGLFNAIIQLAMLPLSFLSLYGWWLISAPDPGQKAGDTGQKPRRIVRAAVIIIACTTTLSAATQFLALAVPAANFALFGIGFIALVASIAQFFASMLYLSWMGPRIPNATVHERAKLYMWLLPVIYLVGSCLVVGPIVAMVMYLLLLNKTRILIRDVRQRQQRGEGTQPFAVNA